MRPKCRSNAVDGLHLLRGSLQMSRKKATALPVFSTSRIPSHSSGVPMILSGPEIQSRLGGDISIEPFEESQLNPNSYNLRLHNELLVYEEVVLDMRRPNRHRRLEIPQEGLVL